MEPTKANAKAKAKVPDTADRSYAGTFVTDVYDPASTVKQPDHLLFADSVHRVLKRVHPDLGIDLGATLVLEDYNRHLLRTLACLAIRLVEGAHRCSELFESTRKKKPRVGLGGRILPDNSANLDDFVIVGQSGNSYLIWLKSPDDYHSDEVKGWETKAFVEKHLGPQLAEYEAKTPEDKKSIFDEWIRQFRSSEYVEDDEHPGGLYAREIQNAVYMTVPGDLASDAVVEGTKASTLYWVSRDRESSNKSRSSRAKLLFDADVVGDLLSRITGEVINEPCPVYLSGVMESMTAQLLKLAGNLAHDVKTNVISPRHILLALREDEELDSFAKGATIMSGGVVPHIHMDLLPRSVSRDGVQSLLELPIDRHLLDKEAGNEASYYQKYHWVGDENVDVSLISTERIRPDLGDYHDPLRHAFESDEPHGTLLCNKSLHDDEDPQVEGLISKVALDALLKVFGDESKDKVPELKTPQGEANSAIQGSIHGITVHQIQRLAARGGCVQLSYLTYEEIRGATRIFLEDLIRDAVKTVEHQKEITVLPEHILAASSSFEQKLWGTGRLYLPLGGTHPYQRSGPDPKNRGLGGFGHEIAVRKAEEVKSSWSAVERVKYSFINGAVSIEDYESKLAKRRESEAEQAETHTLDAGEDERSCEAQLLELEAERATRGAPPYTEYQKKDYRLWHESVKLVRLMQSSNARIIPCPQLAKLVKEVGKSFHYINELIWSPVAINLIDEVLEAYLVSLFEDSLSSAMHGNRSCVEPKDIQFVRRMRGERS